MFEDLTLQCADCGCDFVFTSGEQEFYSQRGFSNQPKRCNECRNKRKQFNKKPQKRLYDAVCSSCGCETQVPFRPMEGKRIFCRECFNNNK